MPGKTVSNPIAYFKPNHFFNVARNFASKAVFAKDRMKLKDDTFVELNFRLIYFFIKSVFAVEYKKIICMMIFLNSNWGIFSSLSKNRQE
jgi:hypothetical protein